MSSGGHRLAGSRTDGKLARRTPRDVRLAFTRATETVAAPPLAERRERRSGRLPSCHARPSFPGRRAALALWLKALRGCAHRSRVGAAVDRVSKSCGELLGQRCATDLPCGSSCATARDASDRFLPSHVFVRAPAPRRFPMRHALARARCGQSPASHQCDWLRWVPRPLSWPSQMGVFFPLRCVAAEPLTSLSPLPRRRGARASTSHRGSRRDRLRAFV